MIAETIVVLIVGFHREWIASLLHVRCHADGKIDDFFWTVIDNQKRSSHNLCRASVIGHVVGFSFFLQMIGDGSP